MKPSACLCFLSFTILLTRNLPFLNVINCISMVFVSLLQLPNKPLVFLYSVFSSCNRLVCVTVYLWLDLCYGVLVGDVYYVKPYHLPITYYLVYGVMSTIRIWETKVMKSWSKYGS